MTQQRELSYTTHARISLAISRGIAAARGDAELTPTHLALGLLRDGENAAVAALGHGGAPLVVIRADLEMALGRPGRPRPGEVAIELTSGERAIVQDAAAVARLREDDFLGPEHFLLAILRDEGSEAAQVFARHGFGYDTLSNHLAAVHLKHV